MRTVRLCGSALGVAVALAFGVPNVAAQARPANTTAQCKDGSYSTAKTKRGACSGHGGIQTWFADERGSTKAAAKSTKDAAKDTGQAAKETTKSAAKTTKSSAKATKDAASGAAASAANAVKPKPSDAPQDATAKCKDGAYSHAKQHRGACSGHAGVAEWYK